MLYLKDNLIGIFQGEKQMCETLLRGVYKKVFFNPGLCQPTTIPKGNKKKSGRNVV